VNAKLRAMGNANTVPTQGVARNKSVLQTKLENADKTGILNLSDHVGDFRSIGSTAN
jgi:hypothetical protein